MLTNSGLLHNGTPGSGDTTAKQADAVERRLRVNSDDGDVCNDRVLREGGSAHLDRRIYERDNTLKHKTIESAYKVMDFLALAGETDSLVGHQTRALCSPDYMRVNEHLSTYPSHMCEGEELLCTFSAKVGLAAFAELALAAFWG